MKRLCKLTIVILFMLLLSSCGQKSDREPNAEGEADQTKSIEAETGKAKNIETDETAEESPADENNTQTQEDEGAMKRDIIFDFETKTVTLNSGYRMPIYGIGTYSLTDSECIDSVTAALENGVRLIDTAYMYHNEESVGEAVRNSGIPREEIFVITKLYPNQFSDPESAIEDALKKLDIGYIDMMLLHHPGAGDVDAYLAMEKAVADGKIRSIGLSNWYVEELEEFHR